MGRARTWSLTQQRAFHSLQLICTVDLLLLSTKLQSLPQALLPIWSLYQLQLFQAYCLHKPQTLLMPRHTQWLWVRDQLAKPHGHHLPLPRILILTIHARLQLWPYLLFPIWLLQFWSKLLPVVVLIMQPKLLLLLIQSAFVETIDTKSEVLKIQQQL